MALGLPAVPANSAFCRSLRPFLLDGYCYCPPRLLPVCRPNATLLPHLPPPPVQVWVKILEVRPEEGPRGGGFKLAASMKAVSQEDGTDLDPDNLMAAGGG